MIAHLRGTLLEKHPNSVILETAGVGYEVFIPVSTYTRLPDIGAEAKLKIHTHVREDAFLLYGFFTKEEKKEFEKKWQDKWEAEGVFRAPRAPRLGKKFYCPQKNHPGFWLFFHIKKVL